ncbi:hypothetical protein OHS33_00620 [Streptomyces sp. NBC_00536]|uniref:hypothetical protein n=1 Tax=Streptomyces sp. NBC_00536 TaxID=2975769 RepID=UPI002E82152B|nr:hypothetical protein [Streptomyces sp. NBC_00536]WUC76978.1 hypothetical protein OHS33_00620 [Streptomyces sp. NBC_00536]
MTRTLTSALTEREVDPDTVHHTLRYYLSERLDDPTTEEMRAELTEGWGPDFAADLDRLAADPLLLENAALLVLSGAWDEPDQAERILQIAADAKAKLPVIEIGIISVAAMYGLYLLRTGGIKRSRRTTIRRRDGSFEEQETVDYADPLGPIAALTRFLGRIQPPS